MMNPQIREGLIKSTRTDWRENFSLCKAKNRRNTGCISRFFNAAGRKIFRQDVREDLFSASLVLLGGFLSSMAAGYHTMTSLKTGKEGPVPKIWTRGNICLIFSRSAAGANPPPVDSVFLSACFSRNFPFAEGKRRVSYSFSRLQNGLAYSLQMYYNCRKRAVASWRSQGYISIPEDAQANRLQAAVAMRVPKKMIEESDHIAAAPGRAGIEVMTLGSAFALIYGDHRR